MRLVSLELPEEILKQGYNLECFGFTGYAWEGLLIKKILEELRKRGIAVKGGDVYKVIGQRLEITCDGWYLNNDGTPEYANKSVNRALAYIEAYEHRNGMGYAFSIII